MNKALFSSDISRKIKKDTYAKQHFIGVFPRDMLPVITKYPVSAVVNTDPSSSPGKHWIAFYINKAKKCVFFYSYGGSPSDFGMLEYLKSISVSLNHNKYQFQDFNTSSCGYYCIFFIILISRGFSLKKITHVFSKKKNFFLNDVFIENLINYL